MVTICLFPVVGFSKTYTIYPVADAYVFVGIDVNFGTELNLVTQPGAYSFLKFDLSTIPATEKITSATFNAFCNQASLPYEFVVQLRAVADTNWTETGITGATGNYPAIGEVIATYDDGRQGEYNQWTVDVVYLPRGLVTLGLSSNSLVVYNSRENESNRPYIQVTTTERAILPRYSYLNLGILPGGGFSDPWSINNNGQIVGYSANRAFLKTVSQPMVDLGTLGGEGSFGADINDAGLVVGDSQVKTGEGRAFWKRPGEEMEDLGLGNGSFATAINASGQVVGQAQNSSGVWRAFLKTPNQPMEDLGALGGLRARVMPMSSMP